MTALSKKLKYIIEYILYYIFVKVLKILGLRRSAKICSAIARTLGPYLKVTKIAKKNIEEALGPTVNKEEIIRGVLDNFGYYIAEIPFVNSLPLNEIEKRIKITGLENVQPLIANKQPYLLCLAHLANWEFAIGIIHKLYPKFSLVYRKANNPYIDKEIFNLRKNDAVTLIAKGVSGAKDLAGAIKERRAIAMLVDQKMNEGITVPFFGKPAMTADAIAKLSLKYNYPIIPCQIIRIKETNFELIISPPLNIIPAGNQEKDCYNIMLAINKIIEQWIREYPSQWLWFHNRWKK